MATPRQQGQAYVPQYQDQPELANAISSDPTFSAIEAEVMHERKTQAMKWWYTYVLTDSIAGQATLPFVLTIEQGTDFRCCYMTASAFSYSASVASDFPWPNSAGLTHWAMRGLTMKITDTRAGRDLTSGQVPFELFATPGYGTAFVKPFPFHYWIMRNSKIRFDIRNNDIATRTHSFNIALHGYKYLSPGS